MLPENGPIVASPHVAPEEWCGVLHSHAETLVLAPGSATGWFGGRGIVAWAPEYLTRGLTLHEAADELQRTFSSAGPPTLAVALLPYDGTVTVARYAGGLVRTPQGWRAWGTLPKDDIPATPAPQCLPIPDAGLIDDASTDLDRTGFIQRVHAIHEAIRAGDVYVVNLTRRITATPREDSAAAFASLVMSTRADMAAYWRTPGVAIASASPERFLRMVGDRVSISPIKGTRPRASGDADAAMVEALLGSEKERAEHVMVVDLERNDLGRVCRYGTVAVDALFEVHSTPYCHQMVSTVSGRLREDVSFGELLDATFPCGSVTGAPKVAAMRTIAELEGSPRGAYTGSLVVSVPGRLDSSILIRTAEYESGCVRWGTGGGITIDSCPDEEWRETLLKSAPFAGTRGRRPTTGGPVWQRGASVHWRE